MCVDGDANGSHGWNLAQMDDGNWYCFDLTWNDFYGGFGYDYFCVHDTKGIQNGRDFLDTHTPNIPESGAVWYLYELLPRSRE